MTQDLPNRPQVIASPLEENAVQDNPWQALRQFTQARIALGRVGVSLPTAPQLAFQLAHAQARDAVHLPLQHETLAQQLALGLTPLFTQAQQAFQLLQLHSAARDRDEYLQRPDLGRQLDVASFAQLQTLDAQALKADLAIVIADGLSALAIQNHALPLLQALLPSLFQADWRMAPLSIVRQGRVAIGDPIGCALQAEIVVVLVGERPGLSSPDSMGLYLTYAPRLGLSDAQRNCISNVRPAGLPFAEAAYKLHYLLQNAKQKKISGVALKDETLSQAPQMQMESNFLLVKE